MRAIARATVLLVDDPIGDAVLAFAAPIARIVHVGKRGGCKSTLQSCVYKGVTSIDTLQSGLPHSLPGVTPAADLQRASIAQQCQLLCTLGTLAASVRTERIGSPVIVIVGDVLHGARSLSQTLTAAHAA